MLLSRRNEGLEAVLRECLDQINADAATAKSSTAKRGKKKA